MEGGKGGGKEEERGRKGKEDGERKDDGRRRKRDGRVKGGTGNEEQSKLKL